MERHEKIHTVINQFLHEAADTNPYASADKIRALDHIIRNTLADHIAHAAGLWRQAYTAHMATLGHPTREHPLPTATDLAQGKVLKQIADRLSALATAILALETPASDRVYHRVRDNDVLLDTLVDLDYAAIPLSQQLERLRPDEPDAEVQITDLMAQIQNWLDHRRQAFSVEP